MESFALYVLSALAFIFVIEGLIYALFPEGVKKMMAVIITLPSEKLRNLGVAMVLIGFAFIWLLFTF